MIMMRAKKRSTVILGEEDVVSGDECVVTSYAELCMI